MHCLALCSSGPCGVLGYPDQALKRIHEALTLAQELSHPFSLAYALNWAAWLHQHRHEGQTAQERAEAMIDTLYRAGISPSGWRRELSCGAGCWPSRDRERKGLPRSARAWPPAGLLGAGLIRPYYLALLAEAYGKAGQIEEGLTVLAEALELRTQNWGAYLRGRAVSAKRRTDAQLQSRGSRVIGF